MGRLLLLLAILVGIFWLIRTILVQQNQQDKRDESAARRDLPPPRDKDRK